MIIPNISKTFNAIAIKTGAKQSNQPIAKKPNNLATIKTIDNKTQNLPIIYHSLLNIQYSYLY